MSCLNNPLDATRSNGARLFAHLQAEIARSALIRNTLILLAISLLPTVAGAWFGIAHAGLLHGWVCAVILVVACIGLLLLASSLGDSQGGFASLLGFTFTMGVLIAPQLTHTLKLPNGAAIVMLAAVGTALILLAMAIYALTTKSDFTGAGPYLLIALLVLVAAGFAQPFLRLPVFDTVLAAATVLLFSVLTVYDVQRIARGHETSAVRAAISLHLNALNIFTALLDLLGED